MTKRLSKYLRDLFILGIGTIISGGFFAFVLFNAKDFWSFSYMPIKIATIILTYILANHTVPGGNVNFYFAQQQHALNDDEKKLDNLIIKYRSKVLVAATAVLFIIGDLFLEFIKHNASIKFDISLCFGLLIGTLAAVGPLLVGVKYFSAWWNIRRNWKREFGE
jgi:hypothetical protein